MQVYVLKFDCPCTGHSYIQVFENLDAVIDRLRITAHHDNMDSDETYTIECCDVTTEVEQKERTQRILEQSIKRNIENAIKNNQESN